MMSNKSDDETEDEPSQEIYGDQKEELVKETSAIKSGYSSTDVAETKDAGNDQKPKKPEWIQKGVKCMALYSGDNLYYRAVIKDVLPEDQVIVIFIGFESEGNEQVPFKHLRRIPKKIIPTKSADEDTKSTDEMASLTTGSFFTHLEGFEMNEEVRMKYEDFGDKDLDIPLQEVKLSKSQGRKRKGVLDVSTHKESKLLRKKQQKKASMNTDDSQLKIHDTERDVKDMEGTLSKKRVRSPEQDDCRDEWSGMDGFDDKDMEKPSFSEPAPDPFVPLVLSEPGIDTPIQVPATINCRLREYQRDGVRFLYHHYHDNKGAILGDDMGLGKTVQVIAFLAAVLGKTGTKSDVFGKYMNQGKKGRNEKTEDRKCFLVVSPGSVLYNWRDELDTWGHFKVKVYHGNHKEGVLEEAAKKKLDVVLTTYDTLRIHLKKFNKVSWTAVIMDEVHKLKDPEAQITVAAKELKATRRFGLTGTPLQNRFDEFWSVLDWANPGCLGSAKKFTKEYSKPVKKGQRYDVTKRELAIGRTISKNFQAKLHGQWFLRRTKDLISDQLPQKDERVVFCNLTSFQEDVYVTLLQSPDVQLITKKDNPCDCGSGLTRGHCCYTSDENGESLRSVLMRYLQLLLKAANHTALLMPQVKQTEDQRIKAKAICDKVFSRHPEYVEAMADSSFQTLSDPSYCGKMKVLDQLLRMFEKEKSKVLLFSQSTQLLDILEEYLIGRGMIYSRLDGKTKTNLRPVIVREFNNSPDIFVCLVSTKAGALGLNFTGANVVIIFDPTWNPANDLQAQDRAYRIGQRRDVQVFRLITSGTIEEMIYLRQVYKQQMANIAVRGTSERRYFIGVEGEKDLKGELFGMENLFSYRAEGVSLAHDIIQRTDKVEAGLRIEKYKIVGRDNENEDKETSLNEDINKTNTNDSGGEDEDDYDLEEMASQYFEDEHEAQPCDSEEASTSGINIKDNYRNKQKCLSDEKVTRNSAQSSGDESSGISQEKHKAKVKGKKMNKNKKKKKRKVLGATRAKDNRARRLRKYVSEFFSCSESTGSETSEESESGDSFSSGVGNRMDGKMRVGRKAGRQDGKESESEVDIGETDEDVTTVGQTDRNTDIQGQELQRTDKHENTGKLRLTGKGKERRRKAKLRKTDNQEDEMPGTESEEEASETSVLGARRRFTRIRQKKMTNRLGKDVEGESEKAEGSVERLVRRPCTSSIDKNNRKNYSQKQTNEAHSPGGGKLVDNQGGCYGNDGYLSMSCDESNQSNHEEETLLPLTRIVTREAGKRARIESRAKGKKPLAGNSTTEDQGMDSKGSKVEEILSKCGVRYTHANRSVVRTSKAECHMTKRAIEDVFELRQFSQQPANCFAALEASEESDDVAEFTTCQSNSKCKKQDKKKAGKNSRTEQEAAARSKAASSSEKLIDETTEIIDGATVIVGGTPRGIRRKHFSDMSSWLGFASEVDFAEKVASQTPESRRELLKTFYSKGKPGLMGLKYFADENIGKATTSKREKRSRITTKKLSESKEKTVKRKKLVNEKAKMSCGKGETRRRRGVVFDDDGDDNDGDGDDDNGDGDGDDDNGDGGDDNGDGDDDNDDGDGGKGNKTRKHKRRFCIKIDDVDDDESDGGDDVGGELKNKNIAVRHSMKRNKNMLNILEDDDDARGSNEVHHRKRKQRKAPRVVVVDGDDDDDDDDDDGGAAAAAAANDDDDGGGGYDDDDDNYQRINDGENKDDENVQTTIMMGPQKRHLPHQTSTSNQAQQTQCYSSSSSSILDEFLGPTREQKSAGTTATSVGLPVSSRPWQREANEKYQIKIIQKSSESRAQHKEEGSKDQPSKRSILDDFI